jgi:hypothetical protein
MHLANAGALTSYVNVSTYIQTSRQCLIWFHDVLVMEWSAMSDSESAQEHQLTMVINGNSATDLFITEKSPQRSEPVWQGRFASPIFPMLCRYMRRKSPPRTIIYVSESTWNHRSLVYKFRTDWKYNTWCNRLKPVNLNRAWNPMGHNAKQVPVDSLNCNNWFFEAVIVPKYRGHHYVRLLAKRSICWLAPGHNHPMMLLGNTFEYGNANPIYTYPITALLSSSVLLVTARIHNLGMCKCNLGILSEHACVLCRIIADLGFVIWAVLIDETQKTLVSDINGCLWVRRELGCVTLAQFGVKRPLWFWNCVWVLCRIMQSHIRRQPTTKGYPDRECRLCIIPSITVLSPGCGGTEFRMIAPLTPP